MLSALGEKIFVDRYALKKYNNFVIGDKVLALSKGQSLLGTVLSLSDDTVKIRLESGETISCEKTPEAMFKRVAHAVAEAEEHKSKWAEEFFYLLSDFKFVPGGRILASAGNDTLTYYNCFVLPSPKDCREGIVETLLTMIEIMSRGGGVGINISSLRTCTNPCFEEPLPDWGVCCLGSLNLPSFIKGLDIAFNELEKAIKTAVRFLDDVIDVTPYFHDDIEQRQKKERRIGLGTMGLAEVLIRLGLRYGSDESIELVNKLYSFIAQTAYLASVDIAKEKGRFPAYDEQFMKSGFMKQMPLEVRGEVAKYGIRNMTILTQAPTGSIATMVGTSTGIEPFFDFRYTRKSQLGVLEEEVKVYADWKEAHPDEALPDYFVTTKDITIDEHIAVQSAVQRWVDASISKTVNLPSEATKDDVSNVFLNLYKSGCKGGTVYRDGSRNEQVLNRQKPEKQSIAEGASHRVKELPYKRQGATVSLKTPSGTAHITMNHDDSGQPFEVFVEIGKAGSSIKAMAEAIGRLISLIFRLKDIPQQQRATEIIEQLSGIGGAHSVGFGKNKVLSLPDAISKALAEHYRISELRNQSIPNSSADICPVCGQSSYVREEGCTHCLSCGHSEC